MFSRMRCFLRTACARRALTGTHRRVDGDHAVVTIAGFRHPLKLANLRGARRRGSMLSYRSSQGPGGGERRRRGVGLAAATGPPQDHNVILNSMFGCFCDTVTSRRVRRCFIIESVAVAAFVRHFLPLDSLGCRSPSSIAGSTTDCQAHDQCVRRKGVHLCIRYVHRGHVQRGHVICHRALLRLRGT